MTNPIYRKIQQQLDTYSMGFPATESGIEIKFLEKLFSIADAELFSKLTPKLELPDSVASRTGMDKADTAEKLADMAGRGLLFSKKKNGATRYGTIPFVHGLFEFQINRMDKEIASLARQYMDEEFKDAMASGLSNFLRVIPVQKSVDARSRVAPYEDALKILEKADPLVVSECACRKSAEALDQSCGKPLEVCFMMDTMGQYYLDHNMGREVDMKEAARILADAHDHGMVTQPATSQNPSGLCSCCGDCCGPLSSLKDHPKPAEMVFSNYFATVDSELCTGCETCLERCQISAIGIDDALVAVVNLDRCIGCGLCVTTCPTEAICLEKKSEDKFRLPPENNFAQMVKMAADRGLEMG